MIQQFTSKRDTWLTVVVGVSAVVLVGAGIVSGLSERFLVGGVLILSALGMLWVFFGTGYTVTDTELLVRSGPFRWRVERSTITSVNETTDPIASPASSLDRLEICYAGGSKRILVSPADRPEFRAALNSAS